MRTATHEGARRCSAKLREEMAPVPEVARSPRLGDKVLHGTKRDKEQVHCHGATTVV